MTHLPVPWCNWEQAEKPARFRLGCKCHKSWITVKPLLGGESRGSLLRLTANSLNPFFIQITHIHPYLQPGLILSQCGCTCPVSFLNPTETNTRIVQDLYILAGVQLYTSPFRGRACTTSSREDLDVKKKASITVRRGNPVRNLELPLKLFTRWSSQHILQIDIILNEHFQTTALTMKLVVSRVSDDQSGNDTETNLSAISSQADENRICCFGTKKIMQPSPHHQSHGRGLSGVLVLGWDKVSRVLDSAFS